MTGRAATEKPTVYLKPSSYQPPKAGPEESVRIDATADELALAVLRSVCLVRKKN